MKKASFIALFLYGLLSFSCLQAKCSDWATSVFPSSPTLHQNGIIILEGYASAQDVIRGLGKEYPIYLVNGNQKIKLMVKEIYEGGFRITQAILTPETALTVGLQYKLLVENMPEGRRDFTKSNRNGDDEEASWKIVEPLAQTALQWDKKPTAGKKTLVQYGCGPASYVYFNFAVKSETSFFLRATVTCQKTKAKTTYYLNPNNANSCAVGHGMCSGAFYFSEKDYTITFDLVDMAGNITTWQDKPMAFAVATNPTDDE